MLRMVIDVPDAEATRAGSSRRSGLTDVRRRTEIQLALAAVGFVVWAYGSRADDSRLQWTGIAFFAAATALRFFKKPPEDA